MLNNATQFVAAYVYPANGVYQATVRVCVGTVCATDTLTLRVGVTTPVPSVCVIDKGINMSPRYEARFGYNNVAGVPVVAPKPIVNLFVPGVLDRGQPDILAPGPHTGTVIAPLASTATLSWTIYTNTVNARSSSPRC